MELDPSSRIQASKGEVGGRGGICGVRVGTHLKGYLAHKKPPPRTTLQ